MRRPLLAATAAVLLIPAAPAQARGVTARVIGEPATTKRSVVVPVAAGSIEKLVVPRSGLRGRYGRIAASSLRLGDTVTATVRSVRGGRARATRVKVVRRGAAPAFATLERRRQGALATVRQAIDALPAAGRSASEGGEPAQQRARIVAARYDLNIIVASLDEQAAAFGRLLPGVREAPRVAARVTEARDATRTASTQLQDAVTQLDEALLAVGGDSPEPLPVDVLGTVSQVLDTAVQVLDGLGLPGVVGGNPR
ncbi:MAG: hypothetical protein HZB46_19335 [Solirubrobacterales bacterium]|nr:hypothetical protein [Solirubrobacterales bacterium]